MNDLEIINKVEKEIEALGGKIADLPRRNPPVNKIKQTLVTFPNGYGLSFIEGERTYGLEAGVIIYQSDQWHLTVTTPITNSVIGYLKDEDIIPLIKQVSELPEARPDEFDALAYLISWGV